MPRWGKRSQIKGDIAVDAVVCRGDVSAKKAKGADGVIQIRLGLKHVDAPLSEVLAGVCDTHIGGESKDAGGISDIRLGAVVPNALAAQRSAIEQRRLRAARRRRIDDRHPIDRLLDGARRESGAVKTKGRFLRLSQQGARRPVKSRDGVGIASLKNRDGTADRRAIALGCLETCIEQCGLGTSGSGEQQCADRKGQCGSHSMRSRISARCGN